MKNKNQILEFLGAQISSENDFQIESLYLDSRKCDNKSAFIALKGQSTDGNEYIDTVINKGVKLVLSDSVALKHLSNSQFVQVTERSRSAEPHNPKNSSCHPELDSGSHNNDYISYKVDSGLEFGMTTVIYIENLKDKLPALSKWFYDYKKPQNIIGITGTNGKTSISSYIAQLQELAGQKSLLLGTNGNGIYPDLKESTHTTLDILSLYEVISKFSRIQEIDSKYLKCGQSKEIPDRVRNEYSLSNSHPEHQTCHPELDSGSHNDDYSTYKVDSRLESGMTVFIDNLVMEVSSHSLDQRRVAGLDFDIAVFSNLSHDHLDYHKTMENYFQAKAELFKFDSLKKAVINIDDEHGKKLCDVCSCEVVTVSLKAKNADVYLESKSIEDMQTSFDLYISQEHVGSYQTSLLGGFNLMNLGLSLAALDSSTDREKLLQNISKVKAVTGRMEVIELRNGAKIIIDYAHTPDALEKALQTLKKYTEASLWCIFGCGGDRDTTKRPKMAQTAEKYAGKVVVTEDNDRFEYIESILKDIQNGFLNHKKHKFIPSREEAIKYAIKNSVAGDVILLAGKGHECYIDKNGVKEHFDEREIIYIT